MKNYGHPISTHELESLEIRRFMSAATSFIDALLSLHGNFAQDNTFYARTAAAVSAIYAAVAG